MYALSKPIVLPLITHYVVQRTDVLSNYYTEEETATEWQPCG